MVNYTSHCEPYTRIIEHKHFEMFGPDVYACPKTVVSEEYSTEYEPGVEPYYPVNDPRNTGLHLLKTERPEPDWFNIYFTAPVDTLPVIRGLNFNDSCLVLAELG